METQPSDTGNLPSVSDGIVSKKIYRKFEPYCQSYDLDSCLCLYAKVTENGLFYLLDSTMCTSNGAGRVVTLAKLLSSIG